MTRSSRILLYSIAVLVLGVAGPASTLAKGPPIKVEQADPNFAVQEEQDKPIILKGKNLPGKAEVFFILNKAGDPNDGKTDQVVVVQSTVILNPDTGNLEFDINVAPEAILGDYDIEVIELLSSGGGRKGKGTTLFSVKSKDGGGGTGSTLTATFCLNMPPPPADPPLSLASDDAGGGLASNWYDYCDNRKDRVMILTGSQAGFRFDSNTKNRPPSRWVYVNVLGGPVEILGDNTMSFDSGDYQIDLRFNKGNGGLDLGGMLLDSDPGAPDYFVPVNIWLDSLDDSHSPDGNRFGLAYSSSSDLLPLNDGRLTGNGCIGGSTTLDAQVKQLTDVSWSIESNPANATACLWDLNADLENQSGTPVQMPFYFEIEIEIE